MIITGGVHDMADIAFTPRAKQDIEAVRRRPLRRVREGRVRVYRRDLAHQAFWITTARELRYASIASGPPSEP